MEQASRLTPSSQAYYGSQGLDRQDRGSRLGRGYQPIGNGSEEVRTEAYKVNWKIAIPLLILGIAPGLIYLAGVAMANCLGGKTVRVQREDPTPSSTLYQQAHRPNTAAQRRREDRPSVADRAITSRRSPETVIPTPAKRKKETTKDILAKTTWSSSSSRKNRQVRKVLDWFETNHRTLSSSEKATFKEAASTMRGPKAFVEYITTQQASASRQTTRTPARTPEPAVPVAIREGREPRGHEESVAVNLYMGTRVINMSAVKDRADRIEGMQKMAKTLPYSKKGEPGTFQGFLKQMYNNSYAALYPKG